MNAPRNIPGAFATAAAAISDAPKTAMGLRAALARCRLRNPADLAPFTDDEAREIFEAALSHEPLPAGAVGEAVLAYLLTTSAGKPPSPVVECVLLRFGANNEASRREVAQWLRESGERALVQADMLAAHAATKWGPL